MTQFVYHVEGHAQGFIMGKFIYDSAGQSVGQVTGNRVYRLSGYYVGELFQDMIVQKPVGVRPRIAAIQKPGGVEPPQGHGPRRTMPYDYPDVFHLLTAAEP